MTGRAVANRYARALFEVAQKENADLQKLQRELTEFVQVVTTNETLARVLSNPAVPAPRKRAVVEKLLARAGGLSPILAKLLLLLAERDRLTLLPDLAAAYQRRVMEHRQVVRAEVVTAVALPDDRVAALHAGFARATGRQVQLETRVDRSIIGGAVARIGSTVYDGSVTKQLEKLKQTLIESGQ